MSLKTLDVNLLREKFGSRILLHPYPKPYPDNPYGTKAILLGCDPSNNHCHDFRYVFALQSSHPKFKQFKSRWMKNLEAIGLSWNTVYIQNLCRNYFTEESSKNKIWAEVAELWIPILKKELEQFDTNVPVLLTSDLLYKVLLCENAVQRKASDFYHCLPEVTVPIPSEYNKLCRPLIPFYRHYRYDITAKTNEPYKKAVEKIIHAPRLVY
ncbi:MAG: hypothetical protein ACHQQQ_09125 [Bacteroidota bacterium]